MDQYVQQPGGGNEPNFFRPDEVVVPQNQADTAVSVTPPRTMSMEPMPALPQAAESPASAPSAMSSRSFTWTASEFIEHKKSAAWFLCLMLATVVVTGVTWFAAHDIFLSCMVVLGVGIFGMYATHRPKQTAYSLAGALLAIGSRTYNLNDFHSFSITHEGTLLRIELFPLKRLAVAATFYCRPEDGDRIAALLSVYLPMTPPRNDFADRLMRSIRF